MIGVVLAAAIPALIDFTNRPPSPDPCQWTVGQISAQNGVVEMGQSVEVNIQATSPVGGLLLFSWRASAGRISTVGSTIAAAATYTAPDSPTTDTIYVDITLSGCPSVTRSVPITVIKPQISVPTTPSAIPASPVVSGVPSPDEIAAASRLLTVARQWTAIYSETFNAGSSLWLSQPDQVVSSTIAIKDEQLEFDVTSLVRDGAIDWPNVPSPAITDFYAAVDVQRVQGAADTGAGLSFREDAANRLYGFRINDGGEVFISILAPTGNKRLQTFQSAAVLPMERHKNRLEVIGQGPQFLFFVNGSYLGSLTDTQIASGTIDVIVFIPRQERAVYHFDNLEVRAP